MAKLKWGALVTDGRGKIGGQVLSKNRSGAILRTKVTPTNGKTAAQSAVRAIFTNLSQGWRNLAQAQRDAWNAAVTDYSRTNIFGDLINPSGANLYQRLNNNLINVGEAAIYLPPVPEAVAESSILSATNAVGAATMTLVLNDAVPADTAVKVYATAPMSAGKNFVKSEFRQIAVLAAAAATPYNIKAAYIAKFGSQGAIGQKIFFKAEPVNTNTGQTGGQSVVSVTAIA